MTHITLSFDSIKSFLILGKGGLLIQMQTSINFRPVFIVLCQVDSIKNCHLYICVSAKVLLVIDLCMVLDQELSLYEHLNLLSCLLLSVAPFAGDFRYMLH